MRQISERHQGAAERIIKDIRRRTRKRYSSEEKIRNVLSGLRGEDSIAELCRQRDSDHTSGRMWFVEHRACPASAWLADAIAQRAG